MDNRKLAEMAGYRVEIIHLRDEDAPFRQSLRDPYGVEVDGFNCWWGKAEGIGEGAWKYTPDFLGSVDAALTLPLPSDHLVEIVTHQHKENWHGAKIYTECAPKYSYVYGDTLAQAICRAWMAYMQKEGED
jgi:hypothetical protein